MEKKPVVAAAMLLCIISTVRVIFPEIASESREASTPNRIIHAGGILFGRDRDGNYTSFAGSNSLEGLEQCCEAGYSTVELDFSFTEDGYLVCIHNWSPIFIEGVTVNEPLKLEEFLDSKIYGSFTPISLDEVTEFLMEYEEMTVVTDIKENFPEAIRLISETGLTDRFTVQIYHEEEYEIVRKYGFDEIIYTLYKLDWNEKTDIRAISQFAETHQLAGIAFDVELCDYPDYVEKMREIGVPLFVHTVNENEDRFFEMGISGIYTDRVNRNSQIKQSRSNCFQTEPESLCAVFSKSDRNNLYYYILS